MTVTPSSDAQFLAAAAGSAPAPEQVRDDVWSVPSPMLDRPLPYSFLSVLRDSRGDIHLIDAGFETDDNMVALADFLATIGSSLSAVRTVTVTHNHPDHQGLALRVRAATGALVQMHAADASPIASSAVLPAAELDGWGVPVERRQEMADLGIPGTDRRVTAVDRLIQDGDRLDIPGFDVIAMHTPGHTPGHLCLRDDARALLFTGDHLLPTMHPGLGLGGPSRANPIADYLRGLDRVAVFADHEVLPGHGYRFRGLAQRADQTRQHHLARSRQVSAILATQDDPTIWQIAEQLSWSAGWANLQGFYAFSALAQTAMHRDYLSHAGRD